MSGVGALPCFPQLSCHPLKMSGGLGISALEGPGNAEAIEYLQDFKIAHLVNEMMVELCKAKPADVVSYMHAFLHKKVRAAPVL